MDTPAGDIEAQFAEPFFARRQRLDTYESLRVRSFGGSDMLACQVRRDQPGLGLTLPHARTETFLASIFLGTWSDGDLWCDDRHLRRTGMPSGGLGIFDLRQSWVADLAEPFAALHVYLPMRAFDELTDELRAPPIEQLVCSRTPPPRDHTLLHLVSALLPAMSKPVEANALFADYVFAAIRMHLAQTYGGLKSSLEKTQGALAPWQVRRAKHLLLDDLQANRSLSDLAEACGLSVRHLSRAFKTTTGLPPHRWLLMRRVERAKDLLETTDEDIAAIALACGFADQSHLTRVFHAIIGTSPGAWRRQRLN